MEILHGDDERHRARELGEERREGFVSPVSLSRTRGRDQLAALPPRKEPPELTGVAAERPLGVPRQFRHRGPQDVDERPERPRRLRFGALTDEDACAVESRAREECTHERGLANAGVARDKDDALVARSRGRECRVERAELVLATNELPRDKSVLAPIRRQLGSPSDLHHARILAGDR